MKSDIFNEDARTWIGKEFTAPPYPVTTVDIAKFAISLGLTNPIYFEVEAARSLGYRDVVAPLGYYVVIRLSHPHLVNTSRLARDGTSDYDIPPGHAKTRMAGETSVQFRRSIIAGDLITLHQQISEIGVKEGRSGPLGIVQYTFSYRDAHDEEIIHESYSRLLR